MVLVRITPDARLIFSCRWAFAQLLATLKGRAFADLVGDKFDVDLSGCTPTISVRRFSEATDGNIHTDHRSKVITLLLYFNASWEHEGGRLRMLRSATDIEDYAGEVAPCCGTLLAFRRTDVSYHGHKPFVGERRMLQLSWTRGGEARALRQRADQAGPAPAQHELAGARGGARRPYWVLIAAMRSSRARVRMLSSMVVAVLVSTAASTHPRSVPSV